MRAFATLLLLANLVLLALQLWFSAPASDGAPQELNAERIVLIDPAQLPEARVERQPQADAAAGSCYEWVGLTAENIDQAEALLTQRLPEVKHERGGNEATVRFWVIIPAAPDEETTRLRLSRLQQKGVTDFSVVRDDSDLRNAISLGIYSSTAAAQRRLAELGRLKVAGARALERRSGDGLLLLLRDVDPALLPNLEAAAGELTDSVLRVSQCAMSSPNEGQQ